MEVKGVSYVDDETGATLNSEDLNVERVINLRGKSYDDAGWDAVLDNLTIYEMSQLVSEGNRNVQASPSVAFPGANGNDTPLGLNETYKYSSINQNTSEKVAIGSSYIITDGISDRQIDLAKMNADIYQAEPALAATFNLDLSYRQGKMWGEDALYIDCEFIWGPGANLHRTPYGGRMAEYYSSDPVITSHFGAEQVRGAWEKGCVLVVKHFVVNEQETNRTGIATYTNEQALREVYLRAFEGIITYGEAKGLMASYNRIGILGTLEEYDLMTTVLRKEWGFDGYVITDLCGPTAGLYDGDAAIAAGTNTMLNNSSFNASFGAAVTQSLNPANIKADPVLLTQTREACHRLLYVFVNSAAMNGITTDSNIVYVTAWWQPTIIAVDVICILGAAASIVMYAISANKGKEEK